MSLRARLRIGVALLMSATVAVVCLLYIQSYLRNALERTESVAKSICNHVQAAVVEELQRRAESEKPPPSTVAEAKEFWIRTVRTDAAITAAMKRAATHWSMVAEVFVTDAGGAVLAGSRTYPPDARAPKLPLLSDWPRRSLRENIKQIYVDAPDTELVRPIALEGEQQPVVVVHVVVSSLFIRQTLSAGLEGLAIIAIASLVASLILAFALPSFVLNPLERLSTRLDQMATGAFTGQPKHREEPKEFARVYSKLDTLGRQFRGAQENVDQLRENVEQLLDRLEQAVLMFDGAGRLTMAGSAVRGLLGMDPVELAGRSADRIFANDDPNTNRLIDCIICGEPARDLTIAYHGPRNASLVASVFPLRRGSGGQVVGSLVTLKDAESRGELAAHLDLASRLTAVGQLTRGVAHEIKNPLNAIRLHLELLRNRLDEDTPELMVIAQEISRLDRVVKTFLDFNRPVHPRLEPLDLHEAIEDIARLVTPEAESRKIKVELRKAPGVAVIEGDLDLLKQAILNVVMNAVEAMAENGGGLLTLETVVERGVVEFSVRDTGPGIPAEVQDKIFNLYFSTKARGSGIGLAMAFRFVQLHGGKIEFSTQAGIGTTFRFSFPEAASFPPRKAFGVSRTHRA